MSDPTRLRYDSPSIFFELTDWEHDAPLREAVRACVEAQRKAGGEALRNRFQANPKAAELVSEAALNALILAGDAAATDIVEDRSLSNCLAFNFTNVEDAVISPEVAESRRKVDRLVSGKLLGLFENGKALDVKNSGHFWYPPGGYMGWHTNLRSPGWRLYINYVEEPGKSFFRYREPQTGKVVTSVDRQWNFRFFRIAEDKPLWHAIYSDTDRFSIGYRVTPRPSLADRVKRKLEKLLASR